MGISYLTKTQEKLITEIPAVRDFSGVYLQTIQSKHDLDYLNILDSLTGVSDIILSDWLDITPRTLRNYRSKDHLVLKDTIKEHIILILSLYKHGIDVFDTVESFEEWLSKKNYFLDNKAPNEFLGTISGIKFIDNRLIAMEYGENV